MLTPSTAEDKDVIVCNKETTDKYSFKTLSDLAAKSGEITLGGPPEFATRSPFGIPGFKQLYNANVQVVRAARDRAAAGRRPQGQRRQLRQPLLDQLGHQHQRLHGARPTTRTSSPTRPCCRSSTRPRPRPDVTAVLDAVNAKLNTDGLGAS